MNTTRVPLPDVGKLTAMVLRSRFPEDYEGARFQALALINLIYGQEKQGIITTRETISEILKSDLFHVTLLTQLLEKRGLITRYPLKSDHDEEAKLKLEIRSDAIEAFAEAHRKATGNELSTEP